MKNRPGRPASSIFYSVIAATCSERPNRSICRPDGRLAIAAAAESWRTIKEDFHRNGFYPCLRKKNVTISCGGCTGVMLRGIIHIDREGRVTGFTKTYDRYCGGPMPPDVEKWLVDYIRSVVFPRELRGMSIAVDLGRALKC